MIEKPQDSDEQVARIHAVLDGIAALKHGCLFLHESSCTHLSYAVWSWANEHGHEILTAVKCGCGPEASETWTLYIGSITIHVFPSKIGQLASIDDAAKIEIEKVKREAAARIRELLGEVAP